MNTGFSYAIDSKSGKAIHISEVSEGYPFAVCPECGRKLVTANRNLKKRKVAAYFRHSGDSSCGGMTALHLYAQQILASNKELLVPAYHFQYVQVDLSGSSHQIEWSSKPERNLFEKSVLEHRILPSRYIADVLLESNQYPNLYIEIRVHHETNVEKRDWLRDQRKDVIEIDLRPLLMLGSIMPTEIEEAVISEAPRVWLAQDRFNKTIDDLKKNHDNHISRINKALRRQKLQEEIERNAWRIANGDLIGKIKSYNHEENQIRALTTLEKRFTTSTSHEEHKFYQLLVSQFEGVPKLLDIKVEDELAFKVFRTVWQYRIWALLMDPKYVRIPKSAAYLYQTIRKYPELELTDVAKIAEQAAGEELLNDLQFGKPKGLKYLSDDEFLAIPKPLAAVKNYLDALIFIGCVREIPQGYVKNPTYTPDLAATPTTYWTYIRNSQKT